FAARGGEVRDRARIAVEEKRGAIGGALARGEVALDAERGLRERTEQLLEAGADLDGEGALDEVVVGAVLVFILDECVADLAEGGGAEQAGGGGEQLGRR